MNESGRLPDELQAALAALPVDRPFTATEAAEARLRPQDLRAAVALGFLWHPVRSVYVVRSTPDDLSLRVAVLSLVVPADCVVTDQTAAWLWGADQALAPNAHVEVPSISVFAPPGRRLRNGLVDSGERRLTRGDVSELGGLLVTTPLRTACDIGRLIHRDQALAGMDALAALGAFTLGELNTELNRFKGYRGIIQARALAPLVDPKSGSHSESVMRLRWVDAGLPKPECQIEVLAPEGGFFLLDMGLREHLFAGEYDGAEFHGDEQEGHDEERRDWIRAHGWTIIVVRKHNIYGRQQDIHEILRREFRLLRPK
jgi:hypothetical protein